MEKIKAIIMGAAGRDFHNFNVYFGGNPYYRVAAFTAFQIPNIDKRKYKGIPIYPEEKISALIKKMGVEEVFFSYSDVSYADLMKKAAAVMSAGAGFSLLGPEQTMIKAKKPVIAVTAVRTGCGKSAVSQKIAKYFSERGLKVGVVRHPMPYGDLEKQICQKFSSLQDLMKHKCTIEEREEYEPYLDMGLNVYAGVDYQKILNLVEKENDLVLWDGGNNDTPFYRPDLHIVLTDARRPGHEVSYYPGEINFRRAGVVIITKIDRNTKEGVKIISENIRRFNPRAKVIKARFPLLADKPKLIKGKRVLVVEDGPTTTHGGLPTGAGFLAAQKYKAKGIIDPRPYATGQLKQTFKKYPHVQKVLPAMGYGRPQMKELELAINSAKCDTVILATPARLERFLKINKPCVNVGYKFEEIGRHRLDGILASFLRRAC